MMVMAGRGSAICCNPGNTQSFHLTSFSHPIRVQWVVERRRQSQPRWDWKSRNSLHDKAAEMEGREESPSRMATAYPSTPAIR